MRLHILNGAQQRRKNVYFLCSVEGELGDGGGMEKETFIWPLPLQTFTDMFPVSSELLLTLSNSQLAQANMTDSFSWPREGRQLIVKTDKQSRG